AHVGAHFAGLRVGGVHIDAPAAAALGGRRARLPDRVLGVAGGRRRARQHDSVVVLHRNAQDVFHDIQLDLAALDRGTAGFYATHQGVGPRDAHAGRALVVMRAEGQRRLQGCPVGLAHPAAAGAPTGRAERLAFDVRTARVRAVVTRIRALA